MKTQSLVMALIALNVVTLAFAVSPQDAPSIVRAAGLEIVDARGVVRARLGIKGSDTIELDLFDRTGTIRVKLGAGDDASGLVMGDGTEPLPIHLLARNKPTAERPATTHITLKAPGGRERVITPQ
jgi:hypothetical protein